MTLKEYQEWLRSTDERRWVPVTEKLPPPFQSVWITVVDSAFHEPMVVTGSLNHKNEWEELREIFLPLSNSALVVAWMPQNPPPRPYAIRRCVCGHWEEEHSVYVCVPCEVLVTAGRPSKACDKFIATAGDIQEINNE